MTPLVEEFRELSYSRKKEVLQVLVLPQVAAALAFFLVTPIGRGWRAEPHGLAWHLFYSFTTITSVNPDAPIAFFTGVYVGLVALLLLDDYKKLEGAILSGMTAVAALALWQIGVFVPTVDWATYGVLTIIGAAMSVVGGWLRWGSEGTTNEFRRALVVLYWVMVVVVVVGLFDAHTAYASPIVLDGDQVVVQSFRFVGIEGQGLFRDFAVGAAFLYLFGYFAQYDKTVNVVLVGPQRSGKTTMMAGLNMSAQRKSGGSSQESPSLGELTETLRADNFIGGTARNQVLPLEFTFKHGEYFPRRVTVRTIDYAGENVAEHLNTLAVQRQATVTESLEAAIEVVRFIAWEQQLLGVYERDEEIGTDPREYEKLEDADQSEQVAMLLRDVLYYADRIGLVLPMEDFADVAFDAGTLPSYVPTDEDNVRQMGDRVDKQEYINVYNGIASAYATESGQYFGESYDGDPKDILLIATFADLAKKDFEEVYLDDAPSSSALNNWRTFREYVTDRFIGDDIDGILDKIGRQLVYPVYFSVLNEEPPEDSGEDLQFDLDVDTTGDEPPLRGADKLFERFGR